MELSQTELPMRMWVVTRERNGKRIPETSKVARLSRGDALTDARRMSTDYIVKQFKE